MDLHTPMNTHIHIHTHTHTHKIDPHTHLQYTHTSTHTQSCIHTHKCTHKSIDRVGEKRREGGGGKTQRPTQKDPPLKGDTILVKEYNQVIINCLRI